MSEQTDRERLNFIIKESNIYLRSDYVFPYIKQEDYERLANAILKEFVRRDTVMKCLPERRIIVKDGPREYITYDRGFNHCLDEMEKKINNLRKE